MCKAFDDYDKQVEVRVKTDMVNKMYKNGVSVDDISKMTDIPLEDVKAMITKS